MDQNETEPIITINITLDNLIQAHKALFESYSAVPDDLKEDSLFFMQSILDELMEKDGMRDMVNNKYKLSEKKMKDYYKLAN